MIRENKENIDDLLEEFLADQPADQAAQDFQKAEQLLSEYPAPKPDDLLLADIKQKITSALVHRKTTIFRRFVYKAASVAAVFILLAAVSVMVYNTNTETLATELIMSTAIWESEDISVDDMNLATLITEIEQLDEELLALEWDENSSNGSNEMMEIELELIEIDDGFWRG